MTIKLILIIMVFPMLAGCAQAPAASPCYPPVVYLQPIEEPLLAGKTNKDLLQYLIDLKIALNLANSDKKALRDWAEASKEQPSH